MATEQEPIESVDDLETEEEESAAPPPTPEVPQDQNEPIEVETDESRKESRRQRRAERQSQFRAAQEETARLRAEVEALRRQPQYQPPPQQQSQQSVHQQRLNQIEAERQRLFAQYEAIASQPGYNRNSPQHQEFERRAQELETARVATIVDARASHGQPDVKELARQIAWQNFQSDHHDVFNHQDAQTWAWGEYYKRRAEGQADTKELAEDVLDAARRRFGMKPRRGTPAPDPATRQRLSGVASRAAGSQSQSGPIKMDANDKRMARIAFMKEGVTEAQAYQKWANTVGKKRDEMSRKGG